MRQTFIKTDNVIRFQTAVSRMEDRENGQPGIALVWGQAGRGKTVALENYYSEHGGVYIDVWEDWTQAAFLQALCFEVCGLRPRGSNLCKVKIVEHLQKDPRTIFVDEADRLHIKRIEDLRDIHRATGCSVVLVGEEELIGLLGERRRIWSRVTEEIEFRPVSPMDVIQYGVHAADLDVTQDACSLIVKNSDGDFRLVRNMMQMLEQAAKAKETNVADAPMVQAVVKTRSWRRS
ncbi:ATP-binding protein [uncultured Pseudodesulfovibrio sp.]|uniref:ATP-binding protein n=1 Tax=uncultured Pseudodesulfovibrio sp. TaxID=2035858 RepID=UPI0029C63F65|nr:ATP-binding protein [uncultured Pseudodesulfovibrio sp.]